MSQGKAKQADNNFVRENASRYQNGNQFISVRQGDDTIRPLAIDIFPVRN